MTQSTLVETCCHNLQTFLLAQMGVEECRTWQRLVLQGEQAEEIISRVRAEEKANQDLTSQSDTPQSHLLNQEEEILWQQKSSRLQRPS